MRRASFIHTQAQMRIGAAAARASADGYAGMVEGGKDITRRLGWHWARAGMFLLAVERTQGIAPGQTVEVFGVLEILSVSRGPLVPISSHDVEREGFPGLTPEQFAGKFLRIAGGGDPCSLEVARIVFRHVDATRVPAAWECATELQREQIVAIASGRNGGRRGPPRRSIDVLAALHRRDAR